jgi:predicted YcjX-like family ATPase
MKTGYQKFAFIGPQCSGKSVLIASLLDRLEKRSETLDKDAEKWTAIRTEGLNSKVLMPFPKDRVLDEMCNRGSWPEPTNHLMGIRWSAKRGKAFSKITHRIERDFIDIPGERFADFMGLQPTSGKHTYASWCEGVLKCFPSNADPLSVKTYKDALSFFEISQSDASMSDYVEQYQEAMRAASDRGRYLITPSTLITKLNGAAEEDFPHDFAPIPKEYRDKFQGWTEAFEQSFIAYQKRVLKPLSKLIYQADVIVIPIDVAWILASGPAAFADYQKLLTSLTFYLESINSFLKRIRSRAKRFTLPKALRDRSEGSLRKIIICGTKLDTFAAGDRSRVEDLVQQMTAPLCKKADLAGVEVKYLACSAVACTSLVKGSPEKLKGYINGKPAKIVPTQLPERWPDKWDAKKYQFAVDFDPRINGNGMEPPPNLHLKQLYEELES